MANIPLGTTVNPAHALAPSTCFLMNEGSGRPVDVGVVGLPAATGDTPTWATESGAPVTVWDGTKHCDYGTGPLLAGKTKFTVVVSVKPANIIQTGAWLAKRTAYQTQAALVIGMMDTGAFGDYVLCEIGNEVDHVVVYGWYAWGPTGNYFDQIVPTTQQQFIFSYDGSLAANQRVKLYKQGVLVPGGIAGAGGASGTPGLYEEANLAVPNTSAAVWVAQGAGLDLANGEYNGSMSYLYVIPDVAVSASQVTSLFANPFPFVITSPLLTAIAHSALAPTSATITWTTEVPATSRVEYGIGNYASVVDVATPVTSHSIPLTGLVPGSTYQYRVKSTITGPVTATSGGYAFLTPAEPAIVSPLFVDLVSATKMRLTVTTDVPTTAVLDYGLTTAYGSQSTDATLRTVHRFSLTGLTPATTYYLRVSASTAAPVSVTQTPDRAYATRAADAAGPSAITTLVANIRRAQNGVRLRWTAPADAGAGRAASYTVKRSASAAPGGVVVSENYRNLPEATTDVAPEVFVGAAGWASESGILDQSPGLDRRLVGVVYRGNDGTQATRTLTLPAPGTYILRLALGDINAQSPQYLQVRDNITPVLTINKPSGNAAARWFDATGTEKTEAAWGTTYASSGVSVTFATTTLTIALGNPTVSGVASSTLAHFSVEASTGGGGAITEGNFAAAVTVPQSLVPQMAGGIEELVVPGLSPSIEYFFAIKSTDAEGNVSAVSNSPAVTTLAGRAPMDLWGGDIRIQSPTGKNVGCTFTGTSTGLTATTLTDSTKSFPVDGRLVGKLVCADTTFVNPVGIRTQWYRITSNTATSVTINPLDGTLTEFAVLGDAYMITGVFTTERIGDQWWFIDPEGNAFFSRGTSLVFDKFSGSFPTHYPYDAIYLIKAGGTVTANLADQGISAARDTLSATADVIHATGATAHAVGDAIYIGNQRPFAETFFQMTQVGVSGTIQWSYSTGSGWTLLGSGTGNPESMFLYTTPDGNGSTATGAWALDRLDDGPPATDAGIRVHWFSVANYPSPTTWAKRVLSIANGEAANTDGIARYWIRGIVTTQFVADPRINCLWDNCDQRLHLDLKYQFASVTPEQDLIDQFHAIGFTTSGYSSSYGDYGAHLVRHLSMYGGTGLTYYANTGTADAAKNIYENVPNFGNAPNDSPDIGSRTQFDMWEAALYAGVTAVVNTWPTRPNPNILFNHTDEPDFQYGTSFAGDRTHMSYCIAATNPYRPTTWQGVAANDKRMFAKYAFRDFLRYRYKPAGESLTAPSRSMSPPLYTYTTGVPTGNELTALNNLNTAWNTTYTTWGTQSGSLTTGTNQWGTGSGFMDEDGRHLVVNYPPNANAGAGSQVSYLHIEANVRTPAIFADIRDFGALCVDRYAYLCYDQMRVRTNNMLTPFLYDPSPELAAVVNAQTDFVWTQASYLELRNADPAIREPAHAINLYTRYGKPIYHEEYAWAIEDSPLNYGGTVTAVSYNSGTDRTAVTWTGKPITVRNHVVNRFRIHGLTDAQQPLAIIADYIGNTIYVDGDITARVAVGNTISNVDPQAVAWGLAIGHQGTRNELAAADRDEMLFPLINAQGPDGAWFWVGWERWLTADNPQGYNNENLAGGLTTSKHNFYDGVQAKRAVGLGAHGEWIGGEDGDYGDYITTIKAALFSIEDTLALRTTAPIAPAFLSAAAVTWTPNVLESFLVVTAGAPTARVTLLSGALPAGVALLDNGDGSAILGGQSAVTGAFPVTLRAQNSRGFVDQVFTLTMGTPVPPTFKPWFAAANTVLVRS